MAGGLLQSSYRMKLKNCSPKIVAYSILNVVSIPIFVAYLWLFLNSFSDGIYLGFIPKRITLQNWRFLWDKVTIGSNVFPSIWPITLNTTFLALGITISGVLSSTLAGYAFSRIEFAGRSTLMKMTIFLHAFPGVALLIALYIVLRSMGLLDKIVGVILVKVALELPMSTWIIKGFFDDISWDIEWAAYLDGCNRIQTWWRIILPQVKSGVAAISIFSFMSGWSEFIYVFTFIYSSRNITLAIFIKNLIGDFKMLDYGILSAAGLFYMFPTILFFICSQKSLMRMSFGGVKG